MVFLVLACISLIIFELSFFMILAFKTRPERWTFKSFCLWLVSLVSWCCFPPLYVWIERKWRQASLRRVLFVLLSPVSINSIEIYYQAIKAMDEAMRIERTGIHQEKKRDWG